MPKIYARYPKFWKQKVKQKNSSFNWGKIWNLPRNAYFEIGKIWWTADTLNIIQEEMVTDDLINDFLIVTTLTEFIVLVSRRGHQSVIIAFIESGSAMGSTPGSQVCRWCLKNKKNWFRLNQLFLFFPLETNKLVLVKK